MVRIERAAQNLMQKKRKKETPPHGEAHECGVYLLFQGDPGHLMYASIHDADEHTVAKLVTSISQRLPGPSAADCLRTAGHLHARLPSLLLCCPIASSNHRTDSFILSTLSRRSPNVSPGHIRLFCQKRHLSCLRPVMNRVCARVCE